jgi:LmbE family N-acetylglucosaminyl deacetylase
VEDREAFIIFSNGVVKVLKTCLPVKILIYELHTPLLPDLVVDVTHQQHLKDRLTEWDLEVDLSHTLSHYRSLTNMRGQGFAEAFVHVSPEILAETKRVGDVSLESLDKGSIPFFRGFERLEGGDLKWWDNHEKRKRALILSPHFDDETIGCGGTISRHVCRGDEVTVIFMTDGREGDPGERDLDLVKAIRKRESIGAMEALGVERMEFLDQPETMLKPGTEVERGVTEIINRFDPDVIYLPSFLENHIDHLELNRLFYRVVKKMDRDLEIRLFGLWTIIPPNFLVDIGDDFDRKIQAINKYRSQITQVDYLSVTIAINRYWSIRYGDGTGYLESFYSVGVREYCSLIEVLGVDSELFN